MPLVSVVILLHSCSGCIGLFLQSAEFLLQGFDLIFLLFLDAVKTFEFGGTLLVDGVYLISPGVLPFLQIMCELLALAPLIKTILLHQVCAMS